MESAVDIAAYISFRYKNEYGANIDEMKLHKLLYFSQRESLIQLGEPLFSEEFRAWKYGPVLVRVREIIRYCSLVPQTVDYNLPEKYQPILDKVFSQYAGKDSWSLSRLSHGEYSWQNARKGLGPIYNCANAITLEDLKVDADRIKLRRYFVSKLDAAN